MTISRDAVKIGLHHLQELTQRGSIGEIALDLETTSLDTSKAHVTWVSWSTGDLYGAIPILHRNPMSLRADEAQVIAILKGILRNPSSTVIWHNGAFDLAILVRRGWITLDDVRAEQFDTMLASYVINPVKRNEKGSHGLKALYKEIKTPSDPEQPTYEATRGEREFEDVEIGEAAWYAAFDAWSTFRLYKKLRYEIEADEELKRYFFSIEMPHLLSSVELRTTGMTLVAQTQVQGRGLKSISDLRHEYERTVRTVFDLVGREFKFNSPTELRRVLFRSGVGLRPLGRGAKSKKYLIDKATLSRILAEQKGLHQRKIVAYVLYAKQLVEVIKKHEEMYGAAVMRDHVIFPRLRSTTSSGRFAASSPNVLSLSRSSRIKSHICPRSGCAFVIADFSQIDLRVIANETGMIKAQSKMLTAVNDGLDLHLNTLSIVDSEVRARSLKKVGDAYYVTRDGERHGVPVAERAWFKEVQKKRSDLAKPINFGISYGLGVSSLLADLNNSDKFRDEILKLPSESVDEDSWVMALEKEVARQHLTLDDVRGYLEKFHSEYPEIASFQEAVERDLQAVGSTRNIFGRRCRIEIIPSILDQTGVLVDVLVGPGQWFRVRILVFRITKKGLRCLVTHVSRLFVAKQTNGGNRRKTSEPERVAGSLIYQLKDDDLLQLLEVARGVRRSSPNEALTQIEELHYESSFGAEEFFQEFKPGPVAGPGDDLGQDADLVAFPFLVIPHGMIRHVEVRGSWVRYPGYDQLRRKLISYRVSSTSMDFCKIAMAEFRIRAKALWPNPKERPRLVNCIHDEIAVECPAQQAEAVSRLLHECMTSHEIFSKYLAPGMKLEVEIDASSKRDTRSYACDSK